MAKVILSVISDLVTDQRVHRSALALHEHGFEVLVVGRKLPGSMEVPSRPYQSKRFRLLFHKGPLFYLFYNTRLFFLLLFSKVDILFSNDLDTLPANFFVSRIRNKKLVYDSHEYFTEVPELVSRPSVQKIWKWMERMMLPKIKFMLTVNESIADLYRKEYGIEVKVMRNVPLFVKDELQNKFELRKKLELPADKTIYIMQGSGINIQRGAEELVEAMQYLENSLLLIIGGGDVIAELKKMTLNLKLQEKIIFKPKMQQQELREYTIASDVGLTLDKDTNLNYRFSLPNKLFDYIHAGIPVLASDLPEVRKIVEKYNVGMILKSHEPKLLAETMGLMTEDNAQMGKWKGNTVEAAKQLNWQMEQRVLKEMFEFHI